MSNTGRILQVIGPVVDVQFAEDALPAIYQALTIDFTVGGQEDMIVDVALDMLKAAELGMSIEDYSASIDKRGRKEQAVT